MHFEISEGIILKEYSNYNPPNNGKHINQECINCPHGIYQEMNALDESNFHLMWDVEYGFKE
jgi:hypothetical protein